MIKLLVPNATAWWARPQKMLTAFLEALDTALRVGVRAFADLVYLDLLPATTRQLDLWDEQFALPAPAGLSDADRRARLASAWSAVGGQSPRYIQDTLRAAGFDVYIHEAWDPVTGAVRNPLLYVRQVYPGTVPGVDCGEALAECGEAFAESGNTVATEGYALVNKYPEDAYSVPNDADAWPYFVYVGGETFGDFAQVNGARRDEFETLCLKICPAHLWLAMLVEY